jgi:CCR4-NOT transcription complex subunit 7/8
MPNEMHCIRDVWRDNLEEEVAKLCEIVDRYPVISMDTEFPGVVVQPVERNTPDLQWRIVRSNVNCLKIIQLGITLCDREGKLPDGSCTWQFNFHFDTAKDMYAQDSLDLLRSAGIDFNKHSKDGIDVHDFAQALTASGLVLSEKVQWVAFHSSFDFAYLLRLVIGEDLPEEESSFMELVKDWFGRVYDVKHLARLLSTDPLVCTYGLNRLAEDLKVSRTGPCHQAGSDSLLTQRVFFELLSGTTFPNTTSVLSSWFHQKEDDVLNVLYGLGDMATAYSPLSIFQPPPSAA